MVSKVKGGVSGKGVDRFVLRSRVGWQPPKV